MTPLDEFWSALRTAVDCIWEEVAATKVLMEEEATSILSLLKPFLDKMSGKKMWRVLMPMSPIE